MDLNLTKRNLLSFPLRSFLIITLLTIVGYNANAYSWSVYACAEDDGSTTFYVETYYELTAPVGGLIINGTTYDFDSIRLDVPCGVKLTTCKSQVTLGVQIVNVDLPAGTYSITTTSEGEIDSPWPGCFPVSYTVEDACTMTVSLGSDQDIYLGYEPTECAILSPTITGGTAPYSYSWSTGSTTSTDTVCPDENDTISITVTDSNGCTAVSSVILNVESISCRESWTERCEKYKSKKKCKYKSCRKHRKKCKHKHRTRECDRYVQVCWTGTYCSYTKCVKEKYVWWYLDKGATLGPCATSSAPGFDENYETIIEEENIFLKAYPNPFSSELKINFMVIKDENVEVTITNINGQVIETLYSGDVSGGQDVNLNFNGTGYPNGIYLIQVKSNSVNLVSKVMLSN